MANEVAYSVLPENSDVGRIIDETVSMYSACNQPTKWCVGPWSRPLDLGEHLVRRGFTKADVRGMGIATESSWTIASDVRVEQVTLDSLDTYMRTLATGWSITTTDVDRDVFESSIVASPRVAHHFMSFVGDEPAGTGALILRGDYGYLLGTQVLARFRGRGGYKALLGARLSFLRSLGIEYAVTHAMEQTSAPILEHLGFEVLFRSHVYRLG
jgi:GNAT superfamily N-acetyltransferase